MARHLRGHAKRGSKLTNLSTRHVKHAMGGKERGSLSGGPVKSFHEHKGLR